MEQLYRVTYGAGNCEVLEITERLIFHKDIMVCTIMCRSVQNGYAVNNKKTATASKISVPAFIIRSIQIKMPLMGLEPIWFPVRF